MGARSRFADTRLVDGTKKVRSIRIGDLKVAQGELKIMIATEVQSFSYPGVLMVKTHDGPNLTLFDLNNSAEDIQAKFVDLYGINDSIVPKFELQSGDSIAPQAVITIKTIQR